MDTLIERKPGINRKRLYWVGGVMLGLAVIAYFIFRDTASSMAVEKDQWFIKKFLVDNIFLVSSSFLFASVHEPVLLWQQ